MVAQTVRWNIFAGIMFTVIGMCFLNYYALFPDADSKDEKKYNIDNKERVEDDNKYIVYRDA